MRPPPWLPKAVIGLMAGAAGITYGLDGGGAHVQAARAAVGSTLQLLAPLVAGFGCLMAAAAYARGDRERAVWVIAAWATLAWAAGRAISAAGRWGGGGAAYSPSAADAFYVAFFVLLSAAVWMEARLVWPVLEPRIRRNLVVYGGLIWGSVVVATLALLARGEAPVFQKMLAAFYPAAAMLLVPACLVPAAGFSGGTSAYTWLTLAMAALCMAGASLLHPIVHRADALWVAGFIFLAAGAFWQRAALEEV